MSPDTCRRVRAQIDAMHKTPDRPSRKHTYAAMSRAVAHHSANTLITPDTSVKVWSDLHFGHENIIRYARSGRLGQPKDRRACKLHYWLEDRAAGLWRQ